MPIALSQARSADASPKAATASRVVGPKLPSYLGDPRVGTAADDAGLASTGGTMETVVMQTTALPTLPPPGAFARVLLVEDNVVNQRIADRLLSKRGHHVTIVNNGAEALAMLDQQTFDVVLMDLSMPVMDGLEATAAIRRRELDGAAHVRIVGVSAHTHERERCLLLGMDAFLPKPVGRVELLAAVEVAA